MAQPREWSGWLLKSERLVALMLSVEIAALLVVRVHRAGALWRDECGALQIARLPTFHDIAANFTHEAFPLLFPETLRSYTDMFGTTDASLRTFGLLVGLALICIVWLNSYMTYKGSPLIALTLIGLNASFLTWGTSVRGYGLGSVMVLLALGLAAKAFLQPSMRAVVLLLLAATASVQLLLHNIPLIIAMGLSASLVFITNGKLKQAAVALSLACLSIASILPFAGSYLGANWNILLKGQASLRSVWHQAKHALGSPTWLMLALWGLVLLFTLAAASYRIWSGRTQKSGPGVEVSAFLNLTIITSFGAQFAFLKFVGYTPRPWYYLSLLFVMAGAADLLSGILFNAGWIRVTRVGFATICSILLPLGLRETLTERYTNIDSVAHYLEQTAQNGDLIVVDPWYVGVSFCWYYHGTVPWLTVPMIKDHRFHRYDEVKEQMMSSNPLNGLTEQIIGTLKSGNRVWLVGGVQFIQPDEKTWVLQPAPDSVVGWDESTYEDTWSKQLDALVESHAISRKVAVQPSRDVRTTESIPLSVSEGWQD